MKKIVWVAGIVALVSGVAQATVINFTDMKVTGGSVDVGTLGAIVAPADQAEITSLSYVVSGVDMDGDLIDDTATFSFAVYGLNSGTINSDDNFKDSVYTYELDYNNGTFNAAGEGIGYGAITVAGTGSTGDALALNSAVYKGIAMRRFTDGSESYALLGDVSNFTSTTGVTALNDTAFTAEWASGAWNVLSTDFTVDVIPEPATLGLVVAFSTGMLFIRRLIQM